MEDDTTTSAPQLTYSPGRDPATGEYLPGTSGNPGGRVHGGQAGREVIKAAREYTTEAIETLAELMRQGEKDSVRLSAACALLDRGWGKPKQEGDEGGGQGVHVTVYLPENSRDGNDAKIIDAGEDGFGVPSDRVREKQHRRLARRERLNPEGEDQ